VTGEGREREREREEIEEPKTYCIKDRPVLSCPHIGQDRTGQDRTGQDRTERQGDTTEVRHGRGGTGVPESIRTNTSPSYRGGWAGS